MSYKRNGLRVLGLSLLAALGLMAFSASGAQAMPGLFLILLQPPSPGLFPIPINGQIDTLWVVLVPNLGLEIDCTGLDIEGQLLSDVEGLAKFLLLGCKYTPIGDLSKGLGANCQIYDELPGGGKLIGDILGLYKLKPILANGLQLLILASGDDPKVPGRIELIHSTGCTVPELIELKGSVVFKMAFHDAVKQLILEANEVTQLVLDDLLFYGLNRAFIDGSAWLELGGKHIGCPWGSI